MNLPTKLTAVLLALAASGSLCSAAFATVVVGSYSGVISSGTATGGFGFAETTDLSGQSIHGTFRYDTADLTPACPPADFAACFTGSGLNITQTVNAVTETFLSSVPAVLDPQNHALGGVNLYNLLEDDLLVAATGFLGSPSSHSENYWTSLSVVLPDGVIASPAAGYAIYDGTAQSGGYTPLTGFGFLPQVDRTRILSLTGGYLTTDVDFTFEIRHFSIGPAPAAVPEPGVWALLIAGFGLAGASLRRRRHSGARADNGL